MFADLDVLRLRRERRPENRHIFETHVLDVVLLVGADQLHEISPGRPVIATSSNRILAINPGVCFRIYWLTTGRSRMNSRWPSPSCERPDGHVFQAACPRRLEQEGRHREVDDVEVPQRHLAHILGSAFVPEQEDPGPVHQRMQFSTVIRSTLLFSPSNGAPSWPRVVVAADEAVGDQHVLRIAGLIPSSFCTRLLQSLTFRTVTLRLCGERSSSATRREW